MAGITWIQLAAGAVGLVSLAFFGLFSGYYFRNRRMALELRRAAGEAARLERLRSRPVDDDDGVASPEQQTSTSQGGTA